jgi:hypothetical protein
VVMVNLTCVLVLLGYDLDKHAINVQHYKMNVKQLSGTTKYFLKY